MDLNRRYSRLPDWTYKNFKEMFDDVCKKNADRTAFSMCLDGKTYTDWSYDDLNQQSIAIAKFCVINGLKIGDRVIIFGENRPEWCMSYVAAVRSGLTAVPVDASMNGKGLANIIADSNAKMVFFTASMAKKVTEAISISPVTKTVEIDSIFARREEDAVPGFVSWKDAVEEGKNSDVSIPSADEIDGKSCASIIYTSGTTGMSKGIGLTHTGIIANVNASIQSLNVFKKDIFLGVLPLHHTYAATCSFLCPIIVGAKLVFVERIVPTVILKAIKKTKVTFLIGVPMLFDKIKAGIKSELKKQKGCAKVFVNSMFGLSTFFTKMNIPAGRFLLAFLRKKAGINTIRLGVAGGGPLVWDTAFFYEVLGFRLVQGYGMSENGPLIAVNLPEYKDNHSVGLPVKYTKARIADSGEDGVGEIQVTSPSLMIGYLKNEEATKATFTADGWLRTGDLGYIDKRGFIYITGRSKSIIVTEGGKNVYPEEIELKFDSAVWISEVLITGRKVKKDSQGEEVIAVCVPNWDKIDKEKGEKSRADFANEKVRDEVFAINKTLQSYMKIVDIIIRDEPFEKTSTQKVRRFLYKDYSKALE